VIAVKDAKGADAIRPFSYAPSITLRSVDLVAEAASRSGRAADTVGNLTGIYIRRTTPSALAHDILPPCVKNTNKPNLEYFA
jgi:hypothetical protein